MRRFFILILMLSLLLPFGAVTQAQNDGFIRHVVQPGDNLFRISLRYGVPMTTIQAANPRLVPSLNLIFAGTTLLIPTGSAPPVPPPTGGVYVVRPGDTLSSIAARFGTSWPVLAQINRIPNPNLIFVGQRIQLPGAGGTVPTVTPGGPTVTPSPTVTPGGPTVTPPPTSTPIVTTPVPPPSGQFELGGHVFGYQYAAQMRGAGMTWAKEQIVWDGSAPPSIVQNAINNARSEGFKILLSIVGEPEQIRANPTQYYQNYANFLAGVAALGPDGIEVWNEPNIEAEWPLGLISPQAYTQMLSAAYNAIKGANSNVLVVSGAPAPTGFFGGACTSNGCDDDAFIRGMAANGAANVMDCVGVHYNEGVLPPTATSGDPRGNPNHYSRYYPTMVNLYSSVFPGKPLCFTELGYLSPEGYGPLPPSFGWASGTTAEQQAQWLAQAAELSRQNGNIRMMIVWNVNATTYGADPQAGYAIIRPNNTCLACNLLGEVMEQ